MIKNSLILLFLILSPLINNSAIYRPMSKRNHDFDGDLEKKKIDFDDLCYYHIEHTIHGDIGSSPTTQIEYVKGCKKGQLCKEYIDPTIKTCQNYNKLSYLTMEDSCKYDLQCDGELKCINGICSLKENDSAYEKGGFYFCPSGYTPVWIEGEDAENDYKCRSLSEYNPNGRFFYYNKNEEKIYHYAPEFLKFPGEIVFYDEEVVAYDSENDNKEVKVKLYGISEIKTASIASLEDGTFVRNPITCKSGFAIKYYPDKSLEVPNYDTYNRKDFYRCVSVKEVDRKNCLIKYNLDGTDIVLSDERCDYIVIVLEMFENFKDKMSKCKSDKYDEEPITCGREDLRKYAYFYNNPNEYRLYKDEKQIIDYLIQTAYGSSSYLLINPIFLLILFFL